MAKVKAYFSRKVPFYLLSSEEMGDHESFDAYPVQVEASVLANMRAARRLIKKMEEIFEASTAPEDCAQNEADVLIGEAQLLFKTRRQSNV